MVAINHLMKMITDHEPLTKIEDKAQEVYEKIVSKWENEMDF